MAAADGNRSSGSFAMAVAIRASRASGNDRFATSDSFGASVNVCFTR